MNDTQFEETVRGILARRFDVGRETINAGTLLFKDLAKDSLSLIEVVMNLEREFGVKIQDEDLGKLETVGELTSHLREKISSKAVAIP